MSYIVSLSGYSVQAPITTHFSLCFSVGVISIFLCTALLKGNVFVFLLKLLIWFSMLFVFSFIVVNIVIVVNFKFPVRSSQNLPHIWVFLLLFLPSCGKYRILVPWPGIETMPPAVWVLNLNHWTGREVPLSLVLMVALSFGSVVFLVFFNAFCLPYNYFSEPHVLYRTVVYMPGNGCR